MNSMKEAPASHDARDLRYVPVSRPEDQLTASEDADLAIRLAGVKLILGIFTTLVTLFDKGFLSSPQRPNLIPGALEISLVFTLYLLVSYAALRWRWIPYRTYRIASPFLDVCFAGLLILGTEGYASPFRAWLIFVLACASFNSEVWVLICATALAVIVKVFIALVPQGTPLDLHSFVVQTGFLFGFGSLIVYIGNHIARKSALLRSIEGFGKDISTCFVVPDAVGVLFTAVSNAVRVRGLLLALDSGDAYAFGEYSDPHAKEFQVVSGEMFVGTFRVTTASQLSADEALLIRTVLDRFCLAYRRLEAVEDSRRSAAQEARLRVADELHGTHIQNLAAMGYKIEALMTSDQVEPAVRKDLKGVRSLVSESIVRLREFLTADEKEHEDDLLILVAESKAAWPNMEVSLGDTSGLSSGARVAIGILLREGRANGRKHGQSSWARLEIERRPGMFLVSLQTDGNSPKLPLKGYGYGLSRVSAAVAGANGRMFFDARDEGGACLSAVFEEELAGPS